MTPAAMVAGTVLRWSSLPTTSITAMPRREICQHECLYFEPMCMDAVVGAAQRVGIILMQIS
jgi:hypothetical protein